MPAAPAPTAMPAPAPTAATAPTAPTTPPPVKKGPPTAPPGAKPPGVAALARPKTPALGTPIRAPETKRAHSDSVAEAFDNLQTPTQIAAQGVSTPQDLEEVRRTFHQVAVAHVSQVRDVMLELRFGDADPTWLASTKPALSSLRQMATQVDLAELCKALDDFVFIIDGAVANRARISDDGKAELLRRYQRLIELIPQAFELDAERDRREPIIVESLLFQVEGVERPTMDKLFAVGLNRLDALTNANAQDIVAVSGIREALAEAIVQQFQAYRARTKAAVSARDPAAELRELGELVRSLGAQNDEFERAASGWDDDARNRKRELRKQREQTFQRIKVSLARLGAREQLSKLERLPFQERVEQLASFLSTQSQVR